MAFQLLINNVDYSNYYIAESVSIEEGLQVRGSTMTMDIYIFNAEVSPPLGGQEIVFTRDGTREFAGRISEVTISQLSGPLSLRYSLSCIDFTVDLDATLINAKIASQLAGDMIKDVVAQTGRGVTTNNTEDGITVEAIDADYMEPSAIISRIAEAIEHQWYIDFDRDLNFFFILDRPAPLAEIDVDADTDTYHTISFIEQWERVRNRIIITGAKAKSSNQDSLSSPDGDGSQKFWPLNYEPWNIDDITVTLDGTPQTKKLDTQNGQAGDGLGSAGDVYVCLDNWGIRFPDSFPPGAGVAVAISYNYAYEPVIIVEDPESIALMESRENTTTAPSSGVHELRFNVPDLRVDNEDALWEYGQLLLLRYATLVYDIQFQSKRQGWKAGQYLRIFSTRFNFDKTCYIKSVQKKIERVHPAAEFAYTITASSSMFPG